MPEEEKTINWNSVVTNAVSTLVAAVFVGAAVIVWNAATTIDERIENATEALKSTQTKLQQTQLDLQASQKTMEEEIAGLHAENRNLETQLANYRKVLSRLDETALEGIAAAPLTPPTTNEAADFQQLKQQDIQRIQDIYQKNRFEIQQQALP